MLAALGCLGVSGALMAYPGGHYVLGAHMFIVVRGGVVGAVVAAATLPR